MPGLAGRSCTPCVTWVIPAALRYLLRSGHDICQPAATPGCCVRPGQSPIWTGPLTFRRCILLRLSASWPIPEVAARPGRSIYVVTDNPAIVDEANMSRATLLI